MKTIRDLIQEHDFFHDFSDDELNTVSGCGKNVIFNPQEVIAQENSPANYFYLIRQGKVGITISIPHQKSQLIQTIGAHEIFGWSWLFPPYRWMFDAISIETTHAIALDGKCLREKCEKNTALGYKLMKRFSKLLIERLTETRLQLLDVYGKSGERV